VFGKVRCSCTRGGRRRMKWTKPEFEIIDLCTEVTLYLYNR
jgi:coenzyme PQQ precursor peptide PqqA